MNILITGGLGFLGSNLAAKLSMGSHKVTIVDNLDPRYGGNMFNLHDANMENVRVVNGDTRDRSLMQNLLESQEFVYHFAAQVSYIDSMRNPLEDLEINCTSMLTILESLRALKQRSRVVFASSRMVYGRIHEAPVLETHPIQPISMYGVHKSTSERYLSVYSSECGIPYTVVRITNPYGIKQQIKHSKYSLVGWFIRQAIEGKPIRIFGQGKQKRDYIFSTDITEALAGISMVETTANQTYNLGVGRSTMFRDMVSQIVKIVGDGSIEFVDWPKDYEAIETGDCEVSIDKLRRDLSWSPLVSLSDGIRRTTEYYRDNFQKYA